MGIAFPVQLVYADGSTVTFSITVQNSLLVAAMRNTAYIRHDCGGKAQCGTCRVKVLAGKAAPKGVREASLLEKINADSDERLACQLFPMAPIKVQVNYNRK